MTDFSEKALKENCPHCNLSSFATEHLLKETNNFRVVCDVHPLVEGHILIMPKEHLSCMGEYSEELFQEFMKLYDEFSTFLLVTYGSVASFEHGKIGQTVFHSHVHLLPFNGEPSEIILEGKDKLTKMKLLAELNDTFKTNGQYLFFSIGKNLWIVDTALGAPGFFRNRFASALGRSERGNWKRMHADATLMAQAHKEIANLEAQWKEYV